MGEKYDFFLLDGIFLCIHSYSELIEIIGLKWMHGDLDGHFLIIFSYYTIQV